MTLLYVTQGELPDAAQENRQHPAAARPRRVMVRTTTPDRLAVESISR
jgi:hypothetical protein